MAETLKNKRIATNNKTLLCIYRIDKTSKHSKKHTNRKQTKENLHYIQYKGLISSKNNIQTNEKLKEHSSRKNGKKTWKAVQKMRFTSGQ